MAKARHDVRRKRVAAGYKAAQRDYFNRKKFWGTRTEEIAREEEEKEKKAKKKKAKSTASMTGRGKRARSRPESPAKDRKDQTRRLGKQ